ncbi:sensor histidine kinase [Streptomyces violaceorubidus]
MSGSAPHESARVHGEDASRRPLAAGATTITLAVLVAFFGIGVIYLLEARPSPVGLTAGITALLLVYGLQLTHSLPHLSPWATRGQRWTFGSQILLTYLPSLLYAEAWLATPGFLAGSALLVLPSPWRWTAFAVVVASSGLLVLRAGVGRGSLLYGTVATALTGLVVFGLSELARLVREAHRTRCELTRVVLEAERLRFSRDLHDLLGINLTTIAYKCELARRLPPSQHVRRHQVLTEILESTQRAFDDVRAASQAYRALSLATEIDTVRATLKDMGVHATFRGSAGVLPQAVETALATVLREGVTNLLRHSRVSTCVVELAREGDSVVLVLSNDGVVDRPAAPAGSGLANLRERVEAVDGTLCTEVRDKKWFRLRAVVPVPVESDAPARSLFRAAPTGMDNSASVA